MSLVLSLPANFSEQLTDGNIDASFYKEAPAAFPRPAIASSYFDPNPAI